MLIIGSFFCLVAIVDQSKKVCFKVRPLSEHCAFFSSQYAAPSQVSDDNLIPCNFSIQDSVGSMQRIKILFISSEAYLWITVRMLDFADTSSDDSLGVICSIGLLIFYHPK